MKKNPSICLCVWPKKFHFCSWLWALWFTKHLPLEKLISECILSVVGISRLCSVHITVNCKSVFVSVMKMICMLHFNLNLPNNNLWCSFLCFCLMFFINREFVKLKLHTTTWNSFWNHSLSNLTVDPYCILVPIPCHGMAYNITCITNYLSIYFRHGFTFIQLLDWESLWGLKFWT